MNKNAPFWEHFCIQGVGNTSKKVNFSGLTQKINKEAFCKCEQLVNIELPDGLHNIKDSPFAGCGLETIDFPDGIENISPNAFDSCIKLRRISFKGSAKYILRDAFSDCSQMDNVILPEGFESLGYNSFDLINKEAMKSNQKYEFFIYIPSFVQNLFMALFIFVFWYKLLFSKVYINRSKRMILPESLCSLLYPHFFNKNDGINLFFI